jgi:hypothetical protein
VSAIDEKARASRQGEFDDCWAEAQKVAKTELAAKMSLLGPIILTAGAERWPIRLRFENPTERALWINRNPVHSQGGLPGEYELSVRIKSRTGALRKMKVVRHGDQPGSGDYSLLRSGELLEAIDYMAADEYAISPGEYDLTVCFWDRAPSPPPAPAGALLFRGPLVAGPVRLVRK